MYFYDQSKKNLGLFYLCTSFPFTTSESELDYHHQKLNVKFSHDLPNNLRRRILGRKFHKNLKIERIHNLVPNLPSRNKTLAIAPENSEKTAIDLSMESSTLHEFVNFSQMFSD